MKNIIIILQCAIPFIFANAQIPGQKIDGPIKFNDTLTLKEGDQLTLGSGSSGNFGNFRYIYTPMNAYLGTPEESLSRSFSGKTATVKFFKSHSHKKQGTKVFTVVNLGGFNEVVELVPAIEAGEIIAINGKKVGPQAIAATVINQQLSAADELAKWKKLLDDGVITQEEYDAKKKKILDGN